MIKKNNKSGFSLVELIVAIAILMVLASVLVPSFIYYKNKTRATKDDVKFESICTAFKTALGEPEVRNEIYDLTNESDVMIVCYIDNDGLITFANSDFVYNNQSSMDLDETKLWLNSYQSIGSTYTMENKRFVKQYLVFHITPKTSTTTVRCEYEICKETP